MGCMASVRRGAAVCPARLDAHVVVGTLHDLVRDDGHLFVDLVELAAHEALDGEHGVLRVRHLLPPRRGADEPLTVLREADDGRGRPAAFGVRDHGRLAALEDGHARVRRAEVDTDRLCHAFLLLQLLPEENLSPTLADPRIVLSAGSSSGSRRRSTTGSTRSWPRSAR